MLSASWPERCPDFRRLLWPSSIRAADLRPTLIEIWNVYLTNRASLVTLCPQRQLEVSAVRRAPQLFDSCSNHWFFAQLT